LPQLTKEAFMTIHVDRIVTGGHVLTMNDAGSLYSPGAIAITGTTITAVGPLADITARYTAGEVVECPDDIVIPGLVNAHTHVPMTLLRALADDRRLDVWLMGYMMPVEREFVSPDFVRLGTLLACAEMIRSGVTCFADMYYFEEDVARATVDAGMRALCGQTVLKFPSPDARSYEDSLAYCREFVAHWVGHDLVVPAPAPHAPYSTTSQILRSSVALAVEFNVPLHIHLAETAIEQEDSRRVVGMPVIPWVKKHGLFDAKVLAAHCVHVDDGEMRTMLRAGSGVAHCPTSNLKLASGMAPVRRMVEMGLHVGIGTDGPASNNDLDMFEEMRLAALLAKGTSGDPTALPARQALELATREGARALHLDHLTGSLVPGKRADLAVVAVNALHQTPRFARDPEAPYGQLVYAGKASDVRHVMCNGRWLMRDRELLTLNAGELAYAARDWARRIDAFLIAREHDVLQKLVAVGGVAQEESFEVQVKLHAEDITTLQAALGSPSLPVTRSSHLREYDTYFVWEDEQQGRLRYREDEILDERGAVSNARYRLTLTGPAHEREFPGAVLLSRTRYMAPADRSLRFYREYFQPAREIEVVKERRRYHITYEEVDFALNVDHLTRPVLSGYYVEIKSRTWSKGDAEQKAQRIAEIVAVLGLQDARAVGADYFDLAAQH
jgi:5-methylthioadenosine/S-adenosylhomocysteine deaminase